MMKTLLISFVCSFVGVFVVGMILRMLSGIHMELVRLRITTQAMLDIYCELKAAERKL